MGLVSEEKLSLFQESLLCWYREYGRKFYWRLPHLTNYQYIIAEVLLQRTKAATVAKFYPQFIKDFPNWDTLASCNIHSIEEYLKPIGLYKQRSKRLHSLAVEIVKRDNILPEDREELESIPFIGQYIANAIELIIFKRPSPLIDVNMARVLERFFGSRKMADIRFDPYLQSLAYNIVSHKDSKYINWAILDYAALICQARKPKCEICTLKSNCTFFLNENGKR